MTFYYLNNQIILFYGGIMDDKLIEKFKSHMKIIATLCYVEDNGKVLMMHRNKKENDVHEGKYNGLGGKSEVGEDPYTCVVREVREEAGINIEPIYVANITFENFLPGLDWEVHLFRAKGYSGELIDCLEGDLVWVEKDKLLDLNLWDGDKIFLKHIFEDRFFFGRFEYDDGKLVNHELKFLHFIE